VTLVRWIARGAGPIAVAVIVQSAGNLFFHAVLGRMLGPDEYGALGALLAAMVMLGVPLGALQTAASALGAESGTAKAVLRTVTLWSLPAAALVLVCSPGLQDYFHLDSVLDAALLGPYLLVSAVLAAARGLLLGERRVAMVATTYLVGTGVRMLLGLALAVPFGVAGALLGTVLGEVAALLVGVIRPAGKQPGTGRSGLRLRAVGRAGLAVTGLFLFSTVDLLLARHHLRGGDSGDYVAAATVAKTVLALPAGIMSAVFPRLLSAWAGPGRGRALRDGAALVVGPALLGAAVMVLAPSLVLRLLYGDGFTDAAGLVRLLSSVAALTSVVTLMTNAALARNSSTILVPWAGAVLEVALIEMWHGSAAQIAACSAAALAPTLLVAAAGEIRAWTRRNPQPAGATADRHEAPYQAAHRAAAENKAA
jgi:O-antigen/teichoic acid export membrane protein